MPFLESPKYELLSEGEREEEHEERMTMSASRRQKNKFPCTIRQIAVLLACMITMFAVFKSGQWDGRRELNMLPRTNLDLSKHLHTFVFEEIYGSKPSSESDAAWEALFPIQGGYFRHPEISPERGAFAVFHQLHCLNGIRKAYWKLHGQSYPADPKNNTITLEDDLPLMISPAHVEHCVDLIRNALICRPDLTVEIKDPVLGGVTGFGTEHSCVDWTKVMEWTTQWQTYGH